MAVRRWLLFGFAMSSLVLMTWAGTVLALSVRIDEAAATANPEVGDADRAVVQPVRDPLLVPTHLTDGANASLLALGERQGLVIASAQNTSLGRALAYIAPDANGTYALGNVTLADVPTGNGTQNMTLDLPALAGGARGFVVLGTGETDPRSSGTERVLGEVRALETALALGARFAVGLIGFLTPLMALVLTHRAPQRAGAPMHLCGECRAPLPAGTPFCTRCGAYAQEAPPRA